MPAAPEAPRRRIAIVHCDGDARAELALELADRGFDVSSYPDDRAALEGVRLAPPDLLVLDAIGVDSPSLLSAQPLRSTPVMFLTADAAPPESAPEGALVVSRSASPEALVSSIERVFQRLPWLGGRASDTPDAPEERLAALGLVTAGVVHEINNPLATIILNLGELRKQLPARLDGHAQELLDDTIEAAERIRLIVRDVQDFARARDRDGVGIEVQQVLESALRLVRYLLNDRASVVKRYAPAPLVVAADGRLGQLFVNLLVNAAQAIPEGRARDNTITVSTATSSVGDCVVTIADTGVGIAPDHLEHIFDLFFTTKPADTGTGLGLPLCQAIVASLGGRIEVTSVPGKGSAFRVVLPAATPATLSALGARAVSDALDVVPRRVLVIDDDELLARALVRGLAPHHVEVALRARAGLEALLADDSFDMVLCDLVMPDGSGIELYQELRVKRPGLARRIVFMSAAHGGSVVEAAGGMTNRIVYKPFDVSELRRLLERNLS